MAVEVFANIPTTTVASGGTDAPASGTQQTWTVASSTLFPAVSSSATPPTQLHVADVALNSEIISVINISGTTWTVIRGAESTTPVSHGAGFTIYQVVSAGAYTQLRSLDWLNVVTQFGADPTGAADSSTAIQAAITAAMKWAATTGDDVVQLTPTVFIPFGNYLINTPLNFAAGTKAAIRITGNWGSRLFSNSNSIFDFQTKYLEGLEIDHLTIDATGGHCFTNPALKWSWLHHLYLNQNSPGYSVWNQTQASNQLQNVPFTDIRFFVYPDPSTNARSVPGWNIQCPSGDSFAEVWFTRVEGWNGANANGYLDTTQYLISAACSQGSSTAYASTITFRDCSWHDCLGGAVWIQSGAHIVLDGNSVYDVFQRTSPGTMTLGNDLIKVSTYSGGSPTRGVELRGYVRSQGIAPSSSHDFSCSADTTDIYINGLTPDYFANTGWDGSVNLNGAKTAVIVACDPSMTVTSPGSDTIIIGNGQISIGGVAQLTYDQVLSSLAPTAWWKLADAVASTTAADSSGNGWTGTATSITFGETPGPIAATASDTAALFGSSSSIATSFNPSGITQFSMGAWVNMGGLTPSASYYLAASDATASSNNGIQWRLFYNGSGWVSDLIVGNGASHGTSDSSSGSPISNTGWVFLVVTFVISGSTSIRHYINGVATGSGASLTGTVSAGAGGMGLGYNPQAGGSHFTKEMAQVFFISGTLLTGTQIASLYNAGIATTVTSVTATNQSIVVSGTAAAPTIATGTLSSVVVALTFAASIAVNASLGNDFRVTLTASTGTLANPTNPTDGQEIRVQVTQGGSGSYTLAYGTAYDFGAAGSPTLSTAVGAIDVLTFVYNATKAKWLYLGASLGF